VKSCLFITFLTIIAIGGGNLLATIMMSFWNGGGQVAPFGSPGGVFTAFVQGCFDVGFLVCLLDKFSNSKLIRIPAIVLSCIGILLTIIGPGAYLVTGMDMSGGQFWWLLADVAGTVPWILIAVLSVRDRRLRPQNNLIASTSPF
jgi:hypothetical protein